MTIKRKILIILSIVPLAAIVHLIGYHYGWEARTIVIIQVPLLIIQLSALAAQIYYLRKDLKETRKQLDDIKKIMDSIDNSKLFNN